MKKSLHIHIILPFPGKNKLAYEENGWAYLFTEGIKLWQKIWFCKTESLQWFGVDQNSEFIIMNAENATFHTYIVQKSRSMFSAISDIARILVKDLQINTCKASWVKLESDDQTLVRIQRSNVTLLTAACEQEENLSPRKRFLKSYAGVPVQIT